MSGSAWLVQLGQQVRRQAEMIGGHWLSARDARKGHPGGREGIGWDGPKELHVYHMLLFDFCRIYFLLLPLLSACPASYIRSFSDIDPCRKQRAETIVDLE